MMMKPRRKSPSCRYVTPGTRRRRPQHPTRPSTPSVHAVSATVCYCSRNRGPAASGRLRPPLKSVGGEGRARRRRRDQVRRSELGWVERAERVERWKWGGAGWAHMTDLLVSEMR